MSETTKPSQRFQAGRPYAALCSIGALGPLHRGPAQILDLARQVSIEDLGVAR